MINYPSLDKELPIFDKYFPRFRSKKSHLKFFSINHILDLAILDSESRIDLYRS